MAWMSKKYRSIWVRMRIRLLERALNTQMNSQWRGQVVNRQWDLTVFHLLTSWPERMLSSVRWLWKISRTLKADLEQIWFQGWPRGLIKKNAKIRICSQQYQAWLGVTCIKSEAELTLQSKHRKWWATPRSKSGTKSINLTARSCTSSMQSSHHSLK